MRERASTGRGPVVGGAVLATLIMASCSGGGAAKASTPNRPSPACAYVVKLDQIANSVARADVHDPDTFNATLLSAVSQYVTNVKALTAVTPATLHPSLARVEADVQQYRFTAALTDSADLDAYAQRECGRLITSVTTPAPSTTGSSPTTVSPTTSATAPSDTGTAPASGSTSTTSPSDG